MKSKQFLIIYTMNFLSIFLGNFVLNTYKTYGKTKYTNDAFLTNVGTIGALLSSFRFSWFIIQQKYNFKVSYTILLLIQIVCSITMPLICIDN